MAEKDFCEEIKESLQQQVLFQKNIVDSCNVYLANEKHLRELLNLQIQNLNLQVVELERQLGEKEAIPKKERWYWAGGGFITGVLTILLYSLMR